jgi:uncharacterized protein YgiM (DUF1202 family)
MAIAGLLMVLGMSVASAERVRTTQTTKVMKRPGEKSAVVTRVQKGRTLTVIATEGRWFKVRVNGRTGWVARSTVQGASAREVPRNTRRRPFVDGRSTRRGGWGDAPEDRVGGDAVEDDEDAEPEEDEDEEEARPRKVAKKAKARPRRQVEEDDEDFDDEESSDEGDDEGDEGDEDEEEEAAPPAPKERIVQVAVAKTKLRSKPSKKGRATLRVKKGAKLIVVEEKNDWMLVEDPDGESGWIKKSEIWEPGMRAKRQIRVEGRLGFDRMAQVFRSDGDAQLSNYNVGAAAAAISLRGDYVQKYGPKYLIGAEARYDLGKSTPGIRYSDGTNATDIPFTTHDIDLRAVGGYDFHHKTGAAAFARLGYHYSMFQVASVADFTKNLARLPSETLAGPTIGVSAELPRITEKLGGRLAADYLIAGKRAQTTGLEDGQVSNATALWGALVVDYQWKKDMVIDFAYGYDYAKTVWTGAAPASMRGTNSTEAARKDVTHSLTIGLAKTF